MRIAVGEVNPDHYQLTWIGANKKCNCQDYASAFAAYFYLQTCDMYLQALSFFVTVPIAKNVLDCMLVPVQIENGRGYPVKKLFVNFLKCGFGVYSVITIEMIRRIAYCGVFNGVLSIMLKNCGGYGELAEAFPKLFPIIRKQHNEIDMARLILYSVGQDRGVDRVRRKQHPPVSICKRKELIW